MTSVDAAVGLLHVFGDVTRVRLLSLLEREELTVAELTSITELPQSRVSTHLGKLKEAGLLRDRKTGASTFYALSDSRLPEPAGRVWQLIRGEVADAVLDTDQQRLTELLTARARASSWPDSIAGEMERHYSPGRTWEATARGVLGLLQLGDVLDVGSGDGALAQLLAPRARHITCLDRSEKMIAAARERLKGVANASAELGDMHELPFPAARFDQVLMFNSLTHAHAPERALVEVARVLRPGGTLAITTLHRHSHQAVTAGYGHLQPGYSPAELRQLLEQAGLSVVSSDVTSREKRKPYFEVVSAFARAGVESQGSRSA
jgi:ArsR family transcriptional regulator